MALTESIEYDKIEVVGQYKHVQVRKATVIKKDDAELTRSFERYVLHAGVLDASDNLVDTDISAEPAEVQAICRKSDNAYIPFDHDNRDYQTYLDWVAEGNTAEAAD